MDVRDFNERLARLALRDAPVREDDLKPAQEWATFDGSLVIDGGMTLKRILMGERDEPTELSRADFLSRLTDSVASDMEDALGVARYLANHHVVYDRVPGRHKKAIFVTALRHHNGMVGAYRIVTDNVQIRRNRARA